MNDRHGWTGDLIKSVHNLRDKNINWRINLLSWHSLIKSSLLHPLLNLMTVKQDFQHYLPSTAGASNIIVVGLVFLTMVPNCLKLDNQQSCHPILPMFPHCTLVHLFSFSFFLSLLY